MYSYLYDSYLAEKKYAIALAKTELRLSDLDIAGKINRLSFLKSIKNILQDEAKRGLKNLVVVGNDQTFNQVLNLAVDLNVAIGFIPLGPQKILAKILGLTDYLAACDTLAARKIEKVDVALVNGYYFLTSFDLPPDPIILECNQSYFLTPTNHKIAIKVCNLDYTNGALAKPQDGLLEIVVQEKPPLLRFWSKPEHPISKFLIKQLKISAKKATLIKIDSQKTFKTPVQITIEKQKLALIVGKNRMF